ncbi:hypothetical protein ACWOFR_05160 [Carnobacterium gallinarum]|uniref:hypothetical protein n=1 Tax=Carnobacterium gallinarum TaxID=2749 RepID=UPI00054F4926|nr:hypothetical protein [Carnobacterium gallinarum]
MPAVNELWNNKKIYNIYFSVYTSLDGIEKKEKRFRRIFIFNRNMTHAEIAQVIYRKMDNIREILYIREIAEAISLSD